MHAGADDLAVVTTFFNSSGWRTKPLNYEQFADGLRRAGVRLVTVECAFGDAEFTLPESPDTIRARGRDVLWQKERLLNVAFAALGFDSHRDIRAGVSGCWEWSSDKPALHRWVVEYFGRRRQDG